MQRRHDLQEARRGLLAAFYKAEGIDEAFAAVDQARRSFRDIQLPPPPPIEELALSDAAPAAIAQEDLPPPVPVNEPPENIVVGSYRLELPEPTPAPDWSEAGRGLPSPLQKDRKGSVPDGVSDSGARAFRPGAKFHYSSPSRVSGRHLTFQPSQPLAKDDPREPLGSTKRPTASSSNADGKLAARTSPEAIDSFAADIEWHARSSDARSAVKSAESLLEGVDRPITFDEKSGVGWDTHVKLVSATQEVETRRLVLMRALADESSSPKAATTIESATEHLIIANGLLRRALEARSQALGT
ncbi:MAG: hypothetical protein AB7P37_21025 [Ramlibacter sp.]